MILLWDPLSGWSVLHLGGVLHLWRMLRHPQKAYGLRGLPVRMFGQTKKNICSDNDYHNLDAPCMEYLPTFTPKMQSFVGKYSSTMEHLVMMMKIVWLLVPWGWGISMDFISYVISKGQSDCGMVYVSTECGNV